MFEILISGLFVAFASTCNAVMDETDHEFDLSIFKDLFNFKIFGYTWNIWAGESKMWLNKYENRDQAAGKRLVWFTIRKIKIYVPVQLTDIWHFAKMWMVIFLILALTWLIISFLFGWFYLPPMNTELIILFIASVITYYALCWNVPFMLFYQNIFRVKK